MTEQEIGKCPKCNAAIPMTHSWAWCRNCGESLPKEMTDILGLNDSERVSQDASEPTPVVAVPLQLIPGQARRKLGTTAEEAETNARIFSLETILSQSERDLQKVREDVRRWVDARANLVQTALEARATTQSEGRGLGGVVLGAKFRVARRRAANAAITAKVAEERGEIVLAKQRAEEEVRKIQSRIREVKAELRSLRSQSRQRAPKPQQQRPANHALDLLEKLKEAYAAGLLTAEEYHEKRGKLVSQL